MRPRPFKRLRHPCGLVPVSLLLSDGPGASAMPLWPRPALRWHRRYAWSTLSSGRMQAGRQPRVVLMRDAWVATSRAEAEAIYGPEVMTAYRYYWQNRLAEFRDMGSEAEFTLDHLAHDRLILGEPETCVREFHRWQEATGADYFLLRLRHAHSGGPAHAHILGAIQLFGDHVLPYCR